MNKAEKGCNELLEESAVTNDRNAAVIKISSGERNLQVARFYYILNRLLNHPKNKECNGLVKLLLYDGEHAKIANYCSPNITLENIPSNLILGFTNGSHVFVRSNRCNACLCQNDQVELYNYEIFTKYIYNEN